MHVSVANAASTLVAGMGDGPIWGLFGAHREPTGARLSPEDAPTPREARYMSRPPECWFFMCSVIPAPGD